MAAGNTFVLKPSEETSLVGLKIAEVFDKAGLPPGVLNVVIGDGPTLGEVLYRDPRVKAVLFTGSTAVGRARSALNAPGAARSSISRWAAKTSAPCDEGCQPELRGGYGLVRNVHSSGPDLYGRFARDCGRAGVRVIPRPVRAQSEVSESGGDPRDPHTVIGPLIRASQCPFIAGRIESAKADGARVLCGGTAYEGNYFPADGLVIADAHAVDGRVSGRVVRACCQLRYQGQRCRRCRIQLANNTRYDASSSAVITNDLQLAMRCAFELESGSVHINGSTVHDTTNHTDPSVASRIPGMGREGGQWSMDELTQLKWITIQMGEARYPFTLESVTPSRADLRVCGRTSRFGATPGVWPEMRGVSLKRIAPTILYAGVRKNRLFNSAKERT